jgi:hypothetical protein
MNMKSPSALFLFLLVLLVPVPLLAHGDDTSFEETVAALFPKAKCAVEAEEECSDVTPHEAKLTAEQLKYAAEQSGSKVKPNDNPFVYWTVVDENGRGIGTVIFVDTDGRKGGAELAIGINLDGTLAGVVVEENNEDLPLSSHQFVDQLQGKSIESPLKIGQDIRYIGNPQSGQATLNGVRRGLYLLKAAQGK